MAVPGAASPRVAVPPRPRQPRFPRRGLKFMLVLLQSISDGERDEEHPNLIRVNALKAYEVALKKYHGWMLQKLFMVSAGSAGLLRTRAALP